MRCFITGHKGLIGSNLLIRLIDLGHEVHYDMKVFEIYKWDLVIHLAATTSIATEFNPMIYENNIIFAKKILSTPYKTIYASSCSAKYNTNPYAASKIYNEWLGEKHGNAIGLRFHNLYGNPSNRGLIWFLMNQKDGAKITVRGPELVRDYVAVEDAVDYIISVALADQSEDNIWLELFLAFGDSNSKVIDVGTGFGWQTMDVVNLFQNLSGKIFDISIIEADPGEPKEMVSNNKIVSLSLEQGLLKLINQSK
jgi:nucleoside-diphosphate-sugar epimerase